MKFSIITLALAVSALAMPHGDHSHSHDGEHDHEHDHEVIKTVQQDIKHSVKPLQALANVLPTNITMNGTATNGNSTAYGNSTAPGVSTPAPKENGAIVNNAAFGVVFGGFVAAVVVAGL
ncbi:hypothetical protein BZA77DRAFT_158232 [Pyronema omphalodes]|nr:hypothetical protein BZA77DRAFT_158232 [Pyronema omphalodes]